MKKKTAISQHNKGSKKTSFIYVTTMTTKFIKKTMGFSIIELMIIIVIVGIIAALAFPVYQLHVTRTKVNDVVPYFNKFKNDVINFHQENNTWPSTVDVGGVTFSLTNSTLTPNWSYTTHAGFWGTTATSARFLLFLDDVGIDGWSAQTALVNTELHKLYYAYSCLY